jgi:hypothetical protein
MEKESHNLAVSELLSQVAESIREDEPFKDLHEAFATGLVTYIKAANQHLGMDPMLLLGACELAKATLLHSYHEIMTKQQGWGNS